MNYESISAMMFLYALVNLIIVQQVNADSDLILKPDKSLVIVYPEKALPVEKTAAEELARYIKKSIGMETKVEAESAIEKADAADVYIGQCKLTKSQDFYSADLKQEGYHLIVNNGKLFIYGDDGKGKAFASNNRTGTLFGVYDFLENEIGITWIWPGESGEDVPTHKELQLKPFARLDYPRLSFRALKFSAAYNKYESKEFMNNLKYWFKRMKLSHVPKVWFGHSWGRYTESKADKKSYETVKKHPEWLALWGGKRTKPHYCTSNKEFRDYIVEQCLNHPKNRNFSIVSISPNDGYGFCECKKCRALDPEGTDYSSGVPNLSNRHWAYANYVAGKVKEKNPELGVGMIAYTAYNTPPTNIDKFEDNLFTQVCYSAAYCVKPELRKKFLDNTKKWGAKGLKFAMYEYWGMHYWLDLPYICVSQIKATMPLLYKNGLQSVKSEAQKNFATQGPNYYLAAHLMWNPEIDADKVLERYYKAFGPASGYIKDYYASFENSIIENQDKIKNFAYLELINSWPEIFPEKTIVQAGKLIQKARDAVKGKPIFEQRVKVVSLGFEYTKNMIELLAVYRKLGRAGVPLWCFGYQGAVAEFKYWKKLPKMPKPWVDFWEKHPDVPLEKEEKIKLLKRALYLGDQRERILKQYANLPVVSLGMYKYFEQKGYYPWHQTIKQELNKLTEN